MKLDLEILCDYLPKSYRAKLIAPSKKKLLFRRPLPYISGAQIDPYCLYIALASDLQPIPATGTAMICVGGVLPKAWQTPSTYVLHLQNCTDINTAMQNVFAVYDKFELWDDELRSFLDDYDKIDIKAMLISGAEMLENRLGITDGNLRQLFLCDYNNDNEQVDIEFKDDTYFAQNHNLDNYEGIKSVCRTEREITEPYISNIPNLQHDAYCCNIHSYGHFLGCIHLDSSNRPFRESDFSLAEHYFTYLTKAFRRYMTTKSIDDSPEVRALNKLLDEKVLDSEEQSQLKLREEEYWLCFRLEKIPGELSLPREYLCQVFNIFMPKTVYSVLKDEGIVGLIKLASVSPDSVNNTLDAFADFLHQMGYVGGISNGFSNISEIAPYLRQANYVVAGSVSKGANKTLTYFRECVVDYVLNEGTKDMPSESLYSTGLLALLNHDREKGSDYIKTLNAYLLAETNASRAANDLYIHRSSFLKRFEKIQRHLQMDLEDSDVRLYLRLCLRQIIKQSTVSAE